MDSFHDYLISTAHVFVEHVSPLEHKEFAGDACQSISENARIKIIRRFSPWVSQHGCGEYALWLDLDSRHDRHCCLESGQVLY